MVLGLYMLFGVFVGFMFSGYILSVDCDNCQENYDTCIEKYSDCRTAQDGLAWSLENDSYKPGISSKPD